MNTTEIYTLDGGIKPYFYSRTKYSLDDASPEAIKNGIINIQCMGNGRFWAVRLKRLKNNIWMSNPVVYEKVLRCEYVWNGYEKGHYYDSVQSFWLWDGRYLWREIAPLGSIPQDFCDEMKNSLGGKIPCEKGRVSVDGNVRMPTLKESDFTITFKEDEHSSLYNWFKAWLSQVL